MGVGVTFGVAVCQWSRRRSGSTGTGTGIRVAVPRLAAAAVGRARRVRLARVGPRCRGAPADLHASWCGTEPHVVVGPKVESGDACRHVHRRREVGRVEQVAGAHEAKGPFVPGLRIGGEAVAPPADTVSARLDVAAPHPLAARVWTLGGVNWRNSIGAF